MVDHERMRVLLDLMLPPVCAGCGRVAALLCEACCDSMRSLSDADTTFVSSDPAIVLGDDLVLAFAALAHERAARKTLAALKYQGTSRLAPILAARARPTFEQLLRITGPAVLVPVPVHRERFADRGYNQAALLAGWLARSADLPMRECLRRVRPTTKQHQLSRSRRLANLRGAFAPIGSVPDVAILVDDIVTTTATLEACAAVLSGAGSVAVYGLAIAREV